MKPNIKKAFLAVSLLLALAFLSGCGDDPTPYETNNAENYTVSVKFDANGGIFTSNSSVIVDSYNIDELAKNSKGMAEIALITPDDQNRGNDAFQAQMKGHFLAGWYKNRFESKDAQGNVTYTYSEKWDFENGILEVDPSKTYSSDTPVLTLYAAWVPLFEIEFHSIGSDEIIGNYTFDPTATTEIKVPAWDEATGRVEMYDFPSKSGFTFANAYYDNGKVNIVDTETVAHSGKVNYENGTCDQTVMKLYIDWTEGEWYRIYNVEQFLDNASLNGNYEIYADLDFDGKIWPTSFMYGNFGGSINGNGHTFKNIELVQTNNSKVNAGLFGLLTENASINGVTFENVDFTIKSGTRVAGASFGIFAGTVSQSAKINDVKLLNGKLNIDSASYFASDDYSIGLVCGMGNDQAILAEGLQCTVVGDDPERYTVEINGNSVTLIENK